MASIEELGGREELRVHCMNLDEPELLAQQLVQQGAIHALTSLMEKGCSERTARAMVESLRANMEIVESVAQAKGFNRLFDTPTRSAQ